MSNEPADVIVVGSGNAGMCAALAARETGARVLLLERAPRQWRGGNTAFTGGSMRAAFNGLEDLLELMPDLSSSEIDNTDFGSYTEEAFLEDLGRITEYRTDLDLADVLVRRSRPTLAWMHAKGVRFIPQYGQYSYNVEGESRFFGGTVMEVVGGGPALVEFELKECERQGVEVMYDARAVRLVRGHGGIEAIDVERQGVVERTPAKAVVLACGGFEANLAWRTKYLGVNWEVAKVRGTAYNTGDGHRMAMEIGAAAAGQWSGCHASAYDFNAPPGGKNPQYIEFHKSSYPQGIMVNTDGERFFDEGADFRPFTYAKCGRAILAQPHQRAWQVFDQKTIEILGREYRIPQQMSRVTAATIDELAKKLDGIDADRFVATVREYNSAIDQTKPFNPTVLDGRATVGLSVPKSNWANTLDTPPYVAYMVTCGITFTFGGIQIEPTGARVLDDGGQVIPGLYAAGEMVGGLFYFNYPGGSGLTSGSVFGYLAGQAAAQDRQ